MSIKVSVIEDHREYRESLKLILNTTKGFYCMDCFKSVEDGIDHLYGTDVLLLDIHLPGKSGTESIAKIKEKYPALVIIMLTVFDTDDHIHQAIVEGADGYLLKKTPPFRLLQYIEDAYDGGTPLSPAVAKKAIDHIKKQNQVSEDKFDLSNREMEILLLMTEGFSNEIIAEKLFISEQTVKNHLKRIYEKLNVHSRTQAVIKAFKFNLVNLTNREN